VGRATQIVIWTLSAAFSAYGAIAAWSRYATFHNHTFDLALYARQAWGLAHGEPWEPLLGSHFLGTHVPIVLWPLGLLGAWLDTVPVLLFAQALAFGLATLPLAQIGARRLGDEGALVAALAWLLYPNLGHVVSYEFHPGALAVLPLAFALDALDRGHAGELVLACLAIVCCRADLAVLVLLLGGAALWRAGEQRRAGLGLAALALGYLLVQALVLGRFRPEHGSLSLHFGVWGGSPLGFFTALIAEPARVLAHLAGNGRLGYLPLIVAPLSLMPWLAPRWLAFTLPFVAINLISEFPTTTRIDSHYLTLAVPSLVVAALEGAHWAVRRFAQPWLGTLALALIASTSLATSYALGGMPWSRGYVRADFVRDERSEQAARTLAAISADASVQAPDYLLPHLAERRLLFRGPPPDRRADYVVLDVRHRVRFARQETLLRTQEEPRTRQWLARGEYGLVHAEPTLLTLVRGADPRAGVAARYFPERPIPEFALPLSRCLAVVGAWLAPDGLQLELYSIAPCPADLALRLGSARRPERVDLLYDGLLSPAQLRSEYTVSFHPLDADERAAIVRDGLRVGALRSSGAPPEHGDPISVPVPVVR
jgi:uncharacterized membrane protein